MLEHIKLQNIIFIDVETVPVAPSFSDLPKNFQELWSEKTKGQRRDVYSSEEFYTFKAGLMAEFAKIVCISVGYIFEQNTENHFRLKSYYGNDEKELLSNFANLLTEKFNTTNHYLCAHNGKMFDYPVLCRRMLINGVRIPNILDISSKKPWEVNYLDTMEIWKFGDYKHFTSIKLLAALFDIPTPKDDIDGSQVSRVYWQEKDLERIKTYCQKDTLTVAQLLLRYMGKPIISDNNIEVA